MVNACTVFSLMKTTWASSIFYGGGIKKSLKSLQASAACLPQGLIGILAYWLTVILFFNHVGSNINYHYDFKKMSLFSYTPFFCLFVFLFCFFTTTTTTTSCIKVHFLFSFLTLAVSREQDRMRQAVLGVWALFKQLQTWRNLWPMTS